MLNEISKLNRLKGLPNPPEAQPFDKMLPLGCDIKLTDNFLLGQLAETAGMLWVISQMSFPHSFLSGL